MERNKRKVYRGIVVSDKMDKTITVAVDRYQKTVYMVREVKTKNLAFMMKKNIAGIGDTK